MLCLTRSRTCTCTNMYHPYRNAVLSDTLSSFERFTSQLALVLDIETLTETILCAPEGGEFCPWCARWSCNLRNGNVR
jgi:hypothetical protein